MMRIVGHITKAFLFEFSRQGAFPAGGLLDSRLRLFMTLRSHSLRFQLGLLFGMFIFLLLLVLVASPMQGLPFPLSSLSHGGVVA